jgi:hypothetical protein
MGMTQHDRVAGNAALRSEGLRQRGAIDEDSPAVAADAADALVPAPSTERFGHKARGLVLLGLFAWISLALLLALMFLS